MRLGASLASGDAGKSQAHCVPGIAIVVAVLGLSAPGRSAAAELDGTIVGVADGDTVTLLDANKAQHKSGWMESTHRSARNPTDNVRVSRWPISHTAEARVQIARRSIVTDAQCAG